MTFIFWLAVGLVAVWPLLSYANKKSLRANSRILGTGLIVAAAVYIVFAAFWGNALWVALEAGGVMIYGLFYWLSSRYSLIWLSAGWSLHPAWDGLVHLIGPGVDVAPGWYATACISFDWAVAIYLLVRIKNDRATKTQ